MKPSIRAVLEHYQIEVPETGRRNVLVLCPVHDEHRPSASVNEEEGVMRCMACGFAGDSYSLIMTKEGIDFAAALSFAEKVFGASGPDLPRTARPERVGISGQPRAGGGYKPRYRNAAPTRRRPLSHPGA